MLAQTLGVLYLTRIRYAVPTSVRTVRKIARSRRRICVDFVDAGRSD